MSTEPELVTTIRFNAQAPPAPSSLPLSLCYCCNSLLLRVAALQAFVASLHAMPANYIEKC